MTLYSIPMRPKEPEYKAVEANSVKEAVAKAENFWGHSFDVVNICIECGKPRALNKVFCEEHFNRWYHDEMKELRLKHL